MKKIFLDTNFIIDYLVRDEYKNMCQEFLTEGAKRDFQFFISFLTVANFAYIVRKASKEVLYKYLLTIDELFVIVPNTPEQIREAIKLQSSDFEDALQYSTAISAKCDCIITRNEGDFGFSTIPVLSASDFANRFF